MEAGRNWGHVEGSTGLETAEGDALERKRQGEKRVGSDY